MPEATDRQCHSDGLDCREAREYLVSSAQELGLVRRCEGGIKRNDDGNLVVISTAGNSVFQKCAALAVEAIRFRGIDSAEGKDYAESKPCSGFGYFTNSPRCFDCLGTHNWMRSFFAMHFGNSATILKGDD